MYACPLDVLHHARNEHVRAVGDDVHLQFGAHHVFVHQHGVLNSALQDPPHIAPQMRLIMDNGHVLPADDVGGAQQHRVTEALCRSRGFFLGQHAAPLGALDAVLLQEGVKPFPILRDVDSLRRGAENRDAVAVEKSGQPDGGLPAERHHHANGLLHLDDVHHVLRAKRLEVQPVRRVVVRGDGFRVVVDDDHIIAEFFERPDAVHRGVIEFDSLPDPDRSGTQHHDAGLAGARQPPRFADAVIGGIKIRGLGGEFRAAGVHHFIGRRKTREFFDTGNPPDRGIGIPHFFRGFVKRGGEPGCQFRFQLSQVLQLGNEEAVDAGDFVDFFGGDAALQRFKDRENPAVVPVGKAIRYITPVRGGGVQRVQRNFRSAHRLHQCRLKAGADCHDLAGGFHLRAELPADARELVKRPLGEFDHHIVQCRLEAGAGLARDVVSDFVQRVAERDFCGDLGNRVPGRLAGKRGGTRNARVDLDDGIFKGIRVQRELAVAPAHDSEGRDDLQRGTAQHLQLPVREGECRRHHDAVPGMHADGIHVLHAAHGNHVPARVPHGFKLDLLPAVNIPFHQDLRNGGGVQPGFRDLRQLCRGFRHAAAGSAEGERRAHDDGVADPLRHRQRRFHGMRNIRGNRGLTDLLHGFFEQLPILCTVNRRGIGAEQTHAVLLQESVF